jgi:two-component system sensor histidine kinase FlrB
MLKGNSEMLLSAFQNLITNSIQAMTSGGEITLQLSTENAGSIDFIIEDTGPGIPDDIKENIFDPFFTTRSQGTGLGLAVVKVIARAHGGEVWCEPGTNDGIRFIIRLPLHSSVENADMEASASNAVG